MTHTDLSEVGATREPCLECWRRTSDWDDWSELEHRVHRLADSPYEIEFFRRVLRHVPGLRPADIRVQEEFTYDHVKQGRIDFAIVRQGTRIAIEVDGRQKSPTGQPPDAPTHDKATQRQNALVRQGWQPLRFTNSQVLTKTDSCRAEIEEQLRSAGSPLSPHDRAGRAPRRAAAHSRSRSDTSAHAPRPSRPAESPAASEPTLTEPVSARPSLVRRIAALAVVAVSVGVVAMALRSDGDTSGPGATSPAGSTCPPDYPVKGNESQSGELIYHEPGWTYYDDTNPERCFADGSAAEDAGFRASEVR